VIIYALVIPDPWTVLKEARLASSAREEQRRRGLECGGDGGNP